MQTGRWCCGKWKISALHCFTEIGIPFPKRPAFLQLLLQIMPADFYYTIKQSSQSEFKDRGSRFTAFAFPINSIEDIKPLRVQLKKEHPKANHHCFAYRLGEDGMNFRVSDDGEPSGSAGRPILGQIDSRQLTNVLVVVVRYFGGTLLGVSGLINAYKTAAALALQETAIIPKPLLITLRLEFDYTLMNEAMKLVRQYDCMIVQQDAQLFCSMEIGVPKNKLDPMLTKLTEIKGITVSKPA
jgi:uncharacterized YigZ family protein